MLPSFFESIIKNSPYTTAVLDKELKFVWVTNEWVNKYPAERASITSLIGKKYIDIYRNISPELLDAFERALKGDEVTICTEELNRRIPGGNHISWRIVPYSDDSNECCGITLFAEDLNGIFEKQMLNRLLSVATLQADIFVFEENRDTGETKCVINGRSDKRLIAGEALLKAVPAKYHKAIRDSYLAPGKKVQFPIIYGRGTKDAVIRWVDHTVIKHRFNQETNTSIVMWVDVTERISREAELQETIELSKKAQEEIDHLHKKRSRINNLIHYELRAQAAAIHMMSEGDSKNAWCEHQQDVKSSSEHLLNILDDIQSQGLMINQQPVKARIFKIHDMVSQVDSHLKNLITRSEINYRKSIDIDPLFCQLPWVADDRRISQALKTLIKNACFHSNCTDIELNVSTQLDISQKRWLVCDVFDNGEGLTDKDLRRLAGENIEGYKTEGSGLSLYATKKLLEEVEGSLAFSRNGRLTCFKVRVPIETPFNINFNGVDTSTEMVNSVVRQQLRDVRLLLVDDDEIIRKIGNSFFSGYFDTIHVAKNGSEAIQVLKEGNQVDLVITDLFMPEVSGAELAKWIKRKHKNLPIVGLTAAHLGSDTESFIKAGADYIIQKPLILDELKETLIQLIIDGKLLNVGENSI